MDSNTSNTNTFLLSKNSLRLLHFSVNYAHFYRVMPFRWAQGSELIDYHPQSWNPFSRHSILFAFGFYFIFVIINFLQSIVHFDPSDSRSIMILLLFVAIFWLILSMQYSLRRRGLTFLLVVNQNLRYFTNLQQLYGKHYSTPPPFQQEMTMGSLTFLQAAFVTPLMIFILNIRKPWEPYFLTSLLIPTREAGILDGFWVRLGLALPTVWIFLANWACLLNYTLMGFTPMYMTIFLLAELRPKNNPSPYTQSSIRSPVNVISIYRNLQILTRTMNTVMRDYLLMVITNSCTAFVVWCNFIVIRFHEELTLESLGMALLVSSVSTGALLVIYIKLGEVHEMSRRTLNSWKKEPIFDRVSFGSKDLALFKKYIKSCRALRLDVGSFGFYNRPTSIKIVGKLVFYTVKFLIIMNKILP